MHGHASRRSAWLLLASHMFLCGTPLLRADTGEVPACRKHVITRPDGLRIEVALPDGKCGEQQVIEALESALEEMKSGRVIPTAVSAMPEPEPKRDLPPIIPEEVIPAELGYGDSLDLPWHVTYIPATLLWQPPLAQPGQPRTYLLLSSVQEYYAEDTVETAIGGTFGLLRYGPCQPPREAFQVDFFAVVFSRFSETSRLSTTDYRFGLPLTFAWGPWEGKIGYEHTSTHIGDEFTQVSGDYRRELIRDEFVMAIGYRFLNQFRAYAQFAYGFDIATPGDEDQCDRYNVGLEWYHDVKTPWYGQPFAAVDADIRGDQGYNLNLTGQIGWMWRDPSHRPFFRTYLQFYSGRSIYGHFSDEYEGWVAGGMALDY